MFARQTLKIARSGNRATRAPPTQQKRSTAQKRARGQVGMPQHLARPNEHTPSRFRSTHTNGPHELLE